MKILLIMPDANMHKFRVFGRLKSAREAPLTLTTLAAIAGQAPDIEFRLVVYVDRQNGRVQFNFIVQGVDYVLGQFQGILRPNQGIVVQTFQQCVVQFDTPQVSTGQYTLFKLN